MTTDISAEAIQELLEGVTAGPWRVGTVDDCRVEDEDGNKVAQVDGDYNQPDTWPLMEANARFIAAARELIPALSAALEAEKALREVDQRSASKASHDAAEWKRRAEAAEAREALIKTAYRLEAMRHNPAYTTHEEFDRHIATITKGAGNA